MFLTAMVFMNGSWVPANASEAKTKKRSKIVITSDHMKTENKKKYVEFYGNAKATVEDFVLTSDVLRIYYSDNLNDSKKEKAPVKKGAISKIAAMGNVHITSDQFVADSDLALYMTESEVLILKGPRTKITSGENSIVGAKITYYRSDGRVKIEGEKDNRVKAVFYNKKDEKGKISILPSPDKDEEPLPSGTSKPLNEKEIAE